MAGGMQDESEAILELWSEGVNSRNIAELDSLLAEDFIHSYSGALGTATSDRLAFMETTNAAFHSRRVSDLSMDFLGRVEVVPGTSRNTWIIEGVQRHLEVTAELEGRVGYWDLEVDHQSTIHVRGTSNPGRPLEIFRWEDSD